MSPVQFAGLIAGLLVSFMAIVTGLIAAGAWVMRTHHRTSVEPAITKLNNSLERTVEATERNTTALARAEQLSRDAQNENREAFDGIREIVHEVREEQARHSIRLDGHDTELRDVKRHIGVHRD